MKKTIKTIATLFFISAAALHYANAEDITALNNGKQEQVNSSNVVSVKDLESGEVRAKILSVFVGVPVAHPYENFLVAYDPDNPEEVPDGHSLGSCNAYPLGNSGSGLVTVKSAVYAENELRLELVYQRMDEKEGGIGKRFNVTKNFKVKTVKGVFSTKAELNTLHND